MARVLTFAERFPSYHLKSGQLTAFPSALLASLPENHFISEYDDWLVEKQESEFYSPDVCLLKLHTIRLKSEKPRAHIWKPGDIFSPRVWTGKPYNSKQSPICPDLEVVKVYDFTKTGGKYYLNGHHLWKHELQIVAQNDALSVEDFTKWFKAKEFEAQVICWVDPNYENSILKSNK